MSRGECPERRPAAQVIDLSRDKSGAPTVADPHLVQSSPVTAVMTGDLPRGKFAGRIKEPPLAIAHPSRRTR